MTTKEKLFQVLETLPEARLVQVLDFARFVYWLERQARDEVADWQRFGWEQFARAYGPDEPEYTETDVRPEANP
jgi:hypothetical protein